MSLSIEWEKRPGRVSSLLDPSAPAVAKQVSRGYWLVEIDGHLIGAATTRLPP